MDPRLGVGGGARGVNEIMYSSISRKKLVEIRFNNNVLKGIIS